MSYSQPPYNPYYPGGAPAAGQVPPTSFPGYPPGSLPPGYPQQQRPNTGRSSPTTEAPQNAYPVGGGYFQPQQHQGVNNSSYPVQQQQYPGYPSALPSGGMYPSVPPATGGYSVGQAPGGYSYSPQDLVGYVFTPMEHEKLKHRIEVKFSPAMDKYVRTSEHNQEIAGWRSLAYAEQNIQRKVEQDWKMSYLTRQESSVAGRIEWRFDVSETGRRISKLRVQFPVKLYEDGNVNAYVATDRGTLQPIVDSAHSQEIDAARGCQRFSIIAELSRGKGEHAWQHAQLFRQQLNPGFFSTDDAHYPFRVLVEFD
ncbi:putative Peptide-N(4)-(N-acetyl-beta-glucosaminyl)asparagine amidase [Hypsibius exemplaris]|uniref:Peptide-N(4)-(N-acetyl-beta-glucosaminyl)asparagine amidase n=1 Tax=Hypsibius exemplaris TaxID=2072580 RepID=A0A1W0XD02_HYPEX|nr:putative Peptide-N(4)-(N-acetyl-beta-glucosaminyl)asparagine amidase [Hypsibius exemplaris]